MSDFPSAIAAVRDAVCGILRIRPVRPGAHEFQVAFVGTGWCFSPRRYLATAHHVFDDGKARNPSDKFYAFVVPDNGPVAYHAPVVAVPDRKSTRLNSSHGYISYAVFCLKKKKKDHRAIHAHH